MHKVRLPGAADSSLPFGKGAGGEEKLVERVERVERLIHLR
jgi:hypothetical protein